MSISKKELLRLQYIAECAHDEYVGVPDLDAFKNEFTPEVCEALCERALSLRAENIRLKVKLAEKVSK